jgi:hypothetical protein
MSQYHRRIVCSWRRRGSRTFVYEGAMDLMSDFQSAHGTGYVIDRDGQIVALQSDIVHHTEPNYRL